MAAICLLYNSLTSSGVAQSPSPPVGGAPRCLVTIEGANTGGVRFRADGVAPTGTVGHYLAPGKDYVFDFLGFSNTKFINDTAASTNCTIHFSWLAD